MRYATLATAFALGLLTSALVGFTLSRTEAIQSSQQQAECPAISTYEFPNDWRLVGVTVDANLGSNGVPLVFEAPDGVYILSPSIYAKNTNTAPFNRCALQIIHRKPR